MKKLIIKKSFDRETGIFTLKVRGQDFTFLKFNKDEKECDSRIEMLNSIIDYYEIGKDRIDLELLERTITPQYIFSTVLSGRNEYSIQYNKVTLDYNCTCEHGSLHGVNKESELCKHIKLCQKIEERIKLHLEKQEE